MDSTEEVMSAEAGAEHEAGGSALTPAGQKLSFWQGFSLLINIQVGSGIFSSPAQVDLNTPSPAAALAIWLAAGMVSWAGATSFAELGACLPRNGGMQEYLRHVYGDSVAFMMTWIWVVALKPASIAIQSIILVEMLASAAYQAGGGTGLSAWQHRAIAITVQAILVLMNFRGTKTSAKVGLVFTSMKLAAVVAVMIGGGAVMGASLSGHGSPSAPSDWLDRSWFAPRSETWAEMSGWKMAGHFSSAMYAGLWTFSGWDNANFVAGEVSDTRKQLPRIIHSAMAVVLLSVELLNISYYIMLPWNTFASSNAVAVEAMKIHFGYLASFLMAILISISSAGTISSQFFVTSRITVNAARRGYLPSIFGKLGVSGILWEGLGITLQRNSDTQRQYRPVRMDEMDPNPESVQGEADTLSASVPILAMSINSALTALYIATGTFRSLLTLTGMTEMSFIVLTVLGLLVIRRREPDLPRPYKSPTWVPIVFCVTGVVLLLYSAIYSPPQALTLLSLIGLGALVRGLRRCAEKRKARTC